MQSLAFESHVLAFYSKEKIQIYLLCCSCHIIGKESDSFFCSCKLNTWQDFKLTYTSLTTRHIDTKIVHIKHVISFAVLCSRAVLPLNISNIIRLFNLLDWPQRRKVRKITKVFELSTCSHFTHNSELKF